MLNNLKELIMSNNDPTNVAKQSPTRDKLATERGVELPGMKEKGKNPEQELSVRTQELATDQSIAARQALYEPNGTSLSVTNKCADGISAIVANVAPTGDPKVDLTNNEIIVSMFTRLMADGGTGRIDGFDARLAAIAPPEKGKEAVQPNLKKTDPAEYERLLQSLADDCRANISKITADAKKPGPEGALARQGILGFMGDLGGFEKNTTGFNGYRGPLCDAGLVYNASIAGIFNHQRKLEGLPPPSEQELAVFQEDFRKARAATSEKGGVLSAPEHTAGKKEERIVDSFDKQTRQGLLNQGDVAEEKLKSINPGHQKTLVDAAWPTFLVSKELTQGVTEPVTGHISGTFGEMAFTMNMMCGTHPNTVTRDNPAGKPTGNMSDGEKKVQDAAIGGLASAGLIVGGFHSAVETFQPMSTFATKATQGGLGPKAVAEMQTHAEALMAYANSLGDGTAQRPSTFLYETDKRFLGNSNKLSYPLTAEELSASKESLITKAGNIADAATKAQDMIALLQGADASTATRDVCAVMANLSTSPKELRKLYSFDTRLAYLGQSGGSLQLEKARELAAEPVRNVEQLEAAITAAEEVADQWEKALTDRREYLNSRADKAEDAATKAEAAAKAAPVTIDPEFAKLSASMGYEIKPDTTLQEVADYLRADAKAARAEATYFSGPQGEGAKYVTGPEKAAAREAANQAADKMLGRKEKVQEMKKEYDKYGFDKEGLNKYGETPEQERYEKMWGHDDEYDDPSVAPAEAPEAAAPKTPEKEAPEAASAMMAKYKEQIKPAAEEPTERPTGPGGKGGG
jgi:hypothetical protein